MMCSIHGHHLGAEVVHPPRWLLQRSVFFVATS